MELHDSTSKWPIIVQFIFAKSLSPSARVEAGALSGAGQSAAAKLFHGRSLQRQALDQADDLGDEGAGGQLGACVTNGLKPGVVCTGGGKNGKKRSEMRKMKK